MLKSITQFKIDIIVFMLMCLISCNFSDKDNTEQREAESDVSTIPIHFNSPTASYKRDSLFIVATVWQFIYNEVSPFHFYNTFHIPLDKVKIEVDSIMYSPDSLKLFAFVIETFPDGEHSDSNMINYSGNSLVGYRSNLKKYWTIYNFDQFSTSGFKRYNSIRKLFRNYYFGDGEFRNDTEYIWDTITNDRISAKFGYNLDEPEFWDKSLVWKKGARIPGYFDFQTLGNVKPTDENTIIKLPQLEYSDSLIRMYH